jgi:O-antigen/teichoic acid export membrane protein
MSKVFKNTVIYTLGNLLPQVVAFILLPIYSKYLSPAEFGIISSMQAIQVMLSIGFSLTLERAIIRLYWDYKSDEEKEVFLGTIAISIFTISLVVLSLTFIFRQYIQLIFQDIDYYPYYIYAILSAFLLTFGHIPKYYYRLKNEAGKYLAISLSQLLLNTALIIWFIVFMDEDASGVLKGRMLGALTLVPIYLFITSRKVRFVFNFAMLKESLRYCLPMVPTLIAAWLISQVDIVFIAKYLSLSEVGIFSLSKRIASLLAVFSSAFMLAYHPLYFEIANTTSAENAKKKLFKYNNTFIIFLILFWFFLIFFSKEIIQIFLNEKYYDTYLYIPFIAFAFLVGSVSSTIIGASLQQSKKMKQDMYFSFVGAAVSLLSYYFLIKPYGLYGAVVGIIVSSSAIFLLNYYYSKARCFYIPFDWKSIGILMFLSIVILVVFHLIIDVGLVLSIILKLVTSALLLIYLFKKHGAMLGDIIQFKASIR